MNEGGTHKRYTSHGFLKGLSATVSVSDVSVEGSLCHTNVGFLSFAHSWPIPDFDTHFAVMRQRKDFDLTRLPLMIYQG